SRANTAASSAPRPRPTASALPPRAKQFNISISMKRSAPSTAGPKPARKPRGRPRAFDREAALAAAMEVFWAKGFESTTISDLTQAMGINPPSLYSAFGDKEKLFLEAMERYSDRNRN